MDKNVIDIIEKIEFAYHQNKPMTSELNTLLEYEKIDLLQELLIEILKKHSMSVFPKMVLIFSVKFLRILSLGNWEKIFESIDKNDHSTKLLLYFSYHYLKIDFAKSFTSNKGLDKILKAEFNLNNHLYDKLDNTVEREIEMLNLEMTDFMYIQNKLVSQGAVKVFETEFIKPEILKINFGNSSKNNL